jgi:hypothetical protein
LLDRIQDEAAVFIVEIGFGSSRAARRKLFPRPDKITKRDCSEMEIRKSAQVWY